MEGLLKIIEDNRSLFSKGQKRIADYIVHSYDEAAFMTAAKLGDTVGVSESTVVRFAYSLGLDGYPALQEAGTHPPQADERTENPPCSLDPAGRDAAHSAHLGHE